MALVGAVTVLTGSLLPVIVNDLTLRPAQAGLLVSASAIGYILAATLAGALGDSWGYHRVWLAGIATGFLALIGVSLAPSFGWLLPAIAALGLVGGFCDASLGALLGRMFQGRSGSALNQVFLFVGVGATITPFAIGLALQQGVPWRWQYAAVAVLALITGLLVSTVRVEHSGNASPRGQRSPSVRKLLASPVILASVLTMLLYTGAEGSIFSWVAYYLTVARDLAAAIASMGVAVFWVGIVAGRIVCGRLIERIGYRPIIVGGGMAGALGIALLLLLPGQLLPWAGILLAGLAFGGIYPTILATAMQPQATPREHAGAVTGIICTGGGIGKIAMPWLVGETIEGVSLPLGIGLVIGMSLLMAIVYLRGTQSHKAQSAAR
ncbi:MAG: MFS transporter [Chloroflexi bacterium]|nr:MFS transporter [Chloroflexota bacterium]